MTLAGCCIFDEQLLFLDMPWQICRPGEQEELDLVRLDTDNEVLFYFIPLCVKLAGLMQQLSHPLPSSAWTAAASLPPFSAFICCSMPVLGAWDGGAFDLVSSQPGRRRCLQPPLTGDFKV